MSSDDEQRLELALGVTHVARRRRQPRRHHLVVERRHEHLDPVRVDDPDPVEEVLLAERRRGVRAPRRSAGQLVDELVDPARTDGAGDRADHRLPPRQLHQLALGRKRTSDASSRFKYWRTFWPVSGGATCSDSV